MIVLSDLKTNALTTRSIMSDREKRKGGQEEEEKLKKKKKIGERGGKEGIEGW